MKRAETTATQNNGVFKLHHQKDFWFLVKSMGDGRFTVRIEKVYRKRTLPMNAYLHGYLLPAVQSALIDAGYPKNEVRLQAVKDMLKRMFLTYEVANEKTGEIMQFIRGTSECTTVQLSEFYDDVIRWGIEFLGVQFNLPNEQTELFNQ